MTKTKTAQKTTYMWHSGPKVKRVSVGAYFNLKQMLDITAKETC